MIAQLPQLASLDLSQRGYEVFMGLEMPDFNVIVRNLNGLRKLYLDYVNVSSDATTLSSLTNLSSLMALSLSGCNFFGPLPVSIWNITREICLSNNQFTGKLPSMVDIDISKLSQLTSLDLSGNLLVGEVQSWLFSLPSLKTLILDNNQFSGQLTISEDVASSSSLMNRSSLMTLSLSSCNFSGPLPTWIWNITRDIILSNNWFTGELPSMVDISKLSQLTSLDLLGNLLVREVQSWLFSLPSLKTLFLDNNQFSGQLTISEDVTSSSSLMNRSSLMTLSLSSCNFSGPLPTWIWNITRDIILSNNRFTGELSSMVDISKLSQLTSLDLSGNLLDGEVPSWLFSLPLLDMLNLANNQFSGQLIVIEDVASNNTTLLEYIDLSGNMIQGSFPNSIFELVSLEVLSLSSNNLSGIVDLYMSCKQNNLIELYLSYNGLSLLTKSNSTISSNVAACPTLQSLECSSCNITEFPDFLRTQEDLIDLNLSNNKIHGDIPKWAKTSGKDSLAYLDLSDNFLIGGLDLQWKQLRDHLLVLDLKSNKLHGTLPSTFGKYCSLQTLALNGNQLGGQLLPSLLSCQGLEVLDVENNNFKGTFPYWLGSLPELQVLILHSNNFHGNVGTSNGKHLFSKLRIFDISNNSFNGTLPSSFLRCFKAMMNSTENREELQYLGESYYNDSIILNMKGYYHEFVRILTLIATIDVSNNKLKGEIPEVIGDLVSLRWLNLAHNNFIGRIPPSLASLRELESLDLSSNKLVGQIPKELTSLTSLEFFNVSQNRLVGPIPHGQQFDTFENNSYLGNLGLCGNPLSKKCGDNEAPLQPPPTMVQDGNDSKIKGTFGWAIVGIRYGCGMTIGLVAGYYIVIVRNPVWLLRLARRLKNASNRLF
ncbi:hypothetical protein Nepgr_030485 [Nepenthes gracilis]|uniref:Receptor-like protein 12 n=1 Tax=Nepenthes gracilis TaxID=150966 RepID=A0AAD3TFV3_NEPGR|nr:hypothetical protein Nepgr_030485 [Nepenthes gracilis]